MGADEAGQLFDPKLFPAPPPPKPFTAKDLPKEDVKSIRRFGGIDVAAQTPVVKSEPALEKW